MLLCPCSSCWHVSNLLVFWTFLHHTSKFVGCSTYYCMCLLFLKLLAGVMCCCIARPFCTNCVSFLSFLLRFAFFLLRCLCFFFILLSPFLSLLFFVFSMSGLGFVFFMLKYLKFVFFTTLWFFPFVNLETLCMGMYGLWVILVCDRSKFFVVVVFGLGFLILIWVLDCVYLAVEFCNLD